MLLMLLLIIIIINFISHKKAVYIAVRRADK